MTRKSSPLSKPDVTTVVGRGHIGVMESGMGGDTGEEEVLPGWGPPTRGSH